MPRRARPVRRCVRRSRDRFGGPEVVAVERVPKPVPGPDEVLVRLHASTVSIADHRIRAKDLPARPRLPRRRRARRLPPAHADPRHGRRGSHRGGGLRGHGLRARATEVIVHRGSAMGCHAEYATVRADRAHRADARGHVLRGCRRPRLRRLHRRSRSSTGSTCVPGVEVLVNGASGAVGTAVVQLASRAGARVTAVMQRRQRRAGPLPRRGARHRLRAGGLRGRRGPIRRRRGVRRQRAVRSGPRHPEARWRASHGDHRPPLACSRSAGRPDAAGCS